ncbi:universal stress protein [Halorubrum sp. F4]|uniref:universal stress protein n=1 Tax=Halorubrum sp. F4 TaxID=2989715 RepID=UPI002480FA39|nr:universal stress protein [Halorubrum sp. F4]
MYKHILFPTDGSAGSEAAIAHVRELAEAFDATVHVLHVVDTRQAHLGIGSNYLTGVKSYTGDRPSEEERRRAVEERAQPYVEELADDLEGIETVPVARQGNPHEEILAYIDENDIDLVVMGTEGHTGVERYLLGSVSEKVVRLADAPVVTVRADEVDDE